MRGRALVAVVLAALASVPAPGHTASAASAYRWPLDPRPPVVRAFDPPPQRWRSGHRGVDLSAPSGAPVSAARAGTVRFAGSVAGRPVVSLRHADGIITTYEPVDPAVRTGEHVDRGAVIGTLDAGHDGCPAPACLHWGARRGSGHDAVYLNPLSLLGALRVRLKPLGPSDLTPADAPDRAPPAAVPR